MVSETFREYAFDPYTAKSSVNVVDGTFGGGDEHLPRVKASQPAEFNIAHLRRHPAFHVQIALRSVYNAPVDISMYSPRLSTPTGGAGMNLSDL